MAEHVGSRLRLFRRSVAGVVATRVASLLTLLSLLPVSWVSAQSPTASDDMTLRTDGVGPMRFVAVHGRRSVIMGYPEHGLEIWGYPFQILSGYQVGFRQRGTTTEVDGRLLLRRIDYQPASITRVYVGPDYLVRETLFVPLEDASATMRYEVVGTRPVDVVVHFQPVLDLMWPGATGGQYTRWIEGSKGYQISESGHGISAMVSSQEIVEHDDTVNSTVHAGMGMSFTLRPVTQEGRSRATVLIVLNAAGAKPSAATTREVETQVEQEEAEAHAHYAAVLGNSLRLRTPDVKVNQAVAWAEIALDQAWVCNPMIGCGLVAGYGPSRDTRRPQYAWYFAGDGLVATEALISAGEYGQAQEELAFITKYQEPKTGMIWHEISQSAGYIDWSKYPYMYVHVDISFDYLSTVARYVASSGDDAFAMRYWSSIAKAYAYCRSLIQTSDHLPHIPADKEGGDEQARPADDLSLSAEWLAASSGFEALARLTGHLELAKDAHAANELARKAIPQRYWDEQKNFWIDGHTQSGEVIGSRRHGPSRLIEQHVFSSRQGDTLLDQLAASDFQTDWGLRGVAASAADYDPYSYGRGSVTALGTMQAAITFWREHRPAIGSAIWNEVLQWNTLDAPGHLHELLAGNFYHEQTESVPEQTWSSAGLLDAAVQGMLGLEVHGATKDIELTPHLPPEWDQISIENVRLPGSTIDFKLRQGLEGVELEVSNQGEPAKLLFRPQIPLGAQILEATVNGRTVPAAAETFAEDEHAKLRFAVPAGVSHCRVRFQGGVSVMLDPQKSEVGDPSTGLKLRGVQMQGHVFVIDADVHPRGRATLRLRSSWRVAGQQGATVRTLGGNDYEVTLLRTPTEQGAGKGYQHVHARVTFAAE